MRAERGNRNRLRVAGAALLALLAIPPVSAAATSQGDGRSFVQATIDDVMGILRNGTLPLDPISEI